MEWKVTVKYNTTEKTYDISADRNYGARKAAVEKFLEDYSLPGGGGVDYLTSRRDSQFEVIVRAALDRRHTSRCSSSTEFLLERLSKMRRWIREGSLPEKRKTEATRLLLELEEVIGG